MPLYVCMYACMYVCVKRRHLTGAGYVRLYGGNRTNCSDFHVVDELQAAQGGQLSFLGVQSEHY